MLQGVSFYLPKRYLISVHHFQEFLIFLKKWLFPQNWNVDHNAHSMSKIGQWVADVQKWILQYFRAVSEDTFQYVDQIDCTDR